MGHPIRLPDPAADRARALGNPSRQRIAALLAENPDGLTSTQIHEKLGIESRHLRRHLAELENVGLVDVDRADPPRGRGRVNTYRPARGA